MLAHFFQFTLEILAVLTVAPLDRVGCFAEVITQKRITGAGHAGFVSGEVSRTGLTPLEASEFSHLSLVKVEVLWISNLGQNAGDKDGTEARNGLERVRDAKQTLPNGGIEPFFLVFQSADLLQAQTQDEIDGRLQSLGQVVGVLGQPA